jgi:hypothetical protein
MTNNEYQVMAINKNHEFEELGGVKCAVVEKNASKERVAFLKDLLEHNKFEVVVVPSPPAKAAPPKPTTPAAEGEPPTPNPEPQTTIVEPQTFSIGVTNLAFNPTNAIFGRQLKTRDGHIVTAVYWYQKETASNDEVPYYETKF